tara:strand:- start:152 stop:712 length:561 start_codon:yes stop_codon:yes gene_type:complete
MTKCILVFDDFEKCLNLAKTFQEKSIFLSESTLVIPKEKQLSTDQQSFVDESNLIKIEVLENIRVLNPKLDRTLRQQNMKKWLMPFGFIAGLTFSNMTNLSTFSFLGLNNLGESLFGGALGMASGYLGSIVASASINLNRKKEIRSILNLNKDGKWLMLLESQIGYELPWNLIRESKSLDIIFFEN